MLKRLFSRKPAPAPAAAPEPAPAAAPEPKVVIETRPRPRIEAKTRAEERSLFADLMTDELNSAKEDLSELCNERIDYEKIGHLADGATHIIRVYEGEALKTFAFVNVNPYIYDKATGGYVRPDYIELILICGSYKTGGPYPWKGSELVVDKANELAKAAGKKAIRLEALNPDLLSKVYRPMGFVDVPGKYLYAERPVTGGLRLNVHRRRTKRHSGGRKHRKLRKLTAGRR